MGVLGNDKIKLSSSAPHIDYFKQLDDDNIANSGEFWYFVQNIEKKTEQ